MKQPARARAIARDATSSAAPSHASTARALRVHAPAAVGAPLERDVLAGVLAALKLHPRVAWVHRMNVMSMTLQYKGADRYVQAGFPGLSDIIGMLRTGEFLACEVKRPGGQPTQAQVEFLGLVDRSGGVAFIARSIDDVSRALAPTRGAV